MIDLFDSIEDTIQENKEEVTAIEVKTLDKSCIQEVAKEEAIQENKQEAVKQVETIQDNMQEDKQESQEEATADASEVAIQEIEIKTPNKNSIAIEESQEDKEIESSFKHYLKSIIPMQDFITQEDSNFISFIITIKKADLIGFKAPKVYSSYEHSVKIKQGQEEARKRGKKPGLKPGMKRERSDKKALIDQIKKLSSSFNGNMNNHELAKILNCSLNRICNYKRQIKQQLKNSN